MIRKSLFFFILPTVFAATPPGFGQLTPSPGTRQRLDQLEIEMDPQVEYPGPALPRPPVQPAVDDAGVISSELEAEIKRLAWSKDDFRFIPYGAFWADMIYATARTRPGAYTFYVYSPEVHGEPAFVIDARRTRLGFDVEGPPIPMFNDAKSFAKIEIDFHGSFVIENRPDLLVRLAYWEAKNDDFRILVGHGRDLISPLFPSSLNYSFGYFGGNIGYRRAQFRYERYFRPSDSCLIELQGSLNQNIMRDFSAVSGVVREPGGWPVVQGRLGFVLGDRDGGIGPATLGVSGHVGETGFDFLTTGPPPLNLPPENDLRVRTWSLNADMRIPITDRLGVKGEFFTGSNLSTFYGGIDQGVSLATRTAIRSTGGWIDLWYDITPRLRTHVGWGIDDPNNNDLLFGRTYNQFIYWNAVFEVTEKLVSGFEVCVWKTNYQDLRAGLIPDADLQPRTPGNSVVLQWSVRYNF